MTTTPAWLEAAAKLDEPAKEHVPLTANYNDAAEEDAEEFNGAARPESSTGLEKRDLSKPFEDSGRATQPRPRFTPPIAAIESLPPGEEIDLAWLGYSAAALIPSTVALAAFTLSAIVILRPLVPVWVLHEAADAPLAALWLLQAVRAGYRLLGYNYRLTTRRLILSRGRLYPTDPPLDLATVVKAEVRQTLLTRLIDVGTVAVVPENASATVELTGVRRPKLLAARIEEAATAARESSVTTGRLQTPSERQ